MSAVPTIHRFPVKHEGAFVNAYVVETASGVVAVDGLLQVSAAKEMRAAIERLGKPLLAALLTHSHPTTTPHSARSSPAMKSRSTHRRE